MIRFRMESGCLNEHDIIKLKDLPQFDVDIHAIVTGKQIGRAHV